MIDAEGCDAMLTIGLEMTEVLLTLCAEKTEGGLTNSRPTEGAAYL